jgi:hypothetical protein
MKISFAQQIEEVEREIRLRNDVYPRWVSSGKMRQSVADYHMKRMQAVLETLLWLQTNEAVIKEMLGDAP